MLEPLDFLFFGMRFMAMQNASCSDAWTPISFSIPPTHTNIIGRNPIYRPCVRGFLGFEGVDGELKRMDEDLDDKIMGFVEERPSLYKP